MAPTTPAGTLGGDVEHHQEEPEEEHDSSGKDAQGVRNVLVIVLPGCLFVHMADDLANKKGSHSRSLDKESVSACVRREY